MPIHVSFLDCLRYVMAVIWFIYDDAMLYNVFWALCIFVGNICKKLNANAEIFTNKFGEKLSAAGVLSKDDDIF